MNALDREFEKRLFRSAYDIATGFGLGLSPTIELARRLTIGAMTGAQELKIAGEPVQPEQPHRQ
jgi:hypothetical protein